MRDFSTDHHWLSINTATVRKQLGAEVPLDRIIDQCAERGIRAISPWRDQVAAVGLDKIARQLKAHGIGLSGYCRGGFYPAADAAGLLAALDDTRRSIDEAKTLDAPCLVLVVGALPGALAGKAQYKNIGRARTEVHDGGLAVAIVLIAKNARGQSVFGTFWHSPHNRRMRTPPHAPSHRFSRPATLLAGLCVGALLGACSKEASQGSAKEPAPAAAVTVAAPTPAPVAAAAPTAPSAPGAATLKRASLMALVFPAWQDADKARRGEVRLPKLDDKGKPVPGSATAQKAQITPREVVRLDDTHAVMLTETVELDDQGQPNDSHAAGAWLGAYFFEQGGNGWLPVARNDAVEYMGMSGSFGQTAVARIAPQRYVLTATYGSCWQGYCGGWLSTFGLGAREVVPLVDTIPIAASNTGADEACEQVLSGKPAGAGAPRPNGECFDVNGKPAFALGTDDAPGELRIQYAGAKSAAANKGRARVEKVDMATVYRYQNGRYALSEGRNPVPSF